MKIFFIWMIPLILILVLLIVVIFACLGCYNKLVRLNVSCDEAFATMDVYLKKRFDLIPNLVAAVKGYAAHETETLEKVIQARRENDGDDISGQMRQESQITQSLYRILALGENYPDLKANENFMQLAAELQQVEKDIANARKYYNGVIRQYNTAIQTIPSNFFANMMGYEPRPMYEVDAAYERQNVKVEF